MDVALYQDADVDRKRSPLRGSDAALAEEYDCALLDLDGTAWSGDERIEHAAASVVEARQMGMASAFVTNNAMRTPAQVADKLNGMDFAASADMIMTSAMDIAAIMADELEEGSKVFVIGGAGLRLALEERGFVLVDSADDEPAAVVQGLDKQVDWALLSEGAFAIERGAAFFASNLDATLPVERGQALGNGSLVRAITHATRKRPTAGGKPEPGIYRRAGELVGATNPLAVGDRLETDIMGAVAAGVPAMHVLTGVHQARDVIRAPRGQRPSYLAIDMRGLLEAHPAPKHHRDGTWTCGVSQVAKATRSGALTLDDVELTEPVTVSIDSYRALAAAAWEYADGAGTPVPCPDITVVGNDDPTGIVTAPEAVVDASSEESDFFGVAANADDLPEPGAETPAFLPGEEELEELLESTADLDDQD
ncbi:hydrolase [Schaalia meyeri]|nr:hydrolase [Schaalia meyeri]